MDARLFRLAALVPGLVLWGASSSPAANFSTQNFVITAPTPDIAQQVAVTAERCRVELAREWLGYELPRWFRPCQVTVTVGQIGAGGQTTFTFAAGQVFGWNMKVQGTLERILDSVVPHEVSHTVFATFFRRPLPRWADEGAASLVEHESERRRQQLLLNQVFNTPQRIPLARLISMKDYPSDMQSVLTLYAEGYSLAEYLVQSGGKPRYLRFLKEANDRDWNQAIRICYGLSNVASLEQRWSNWVMAGSPELSEAENGLVAQSDAARARKEGIVYRSQSPDNPEPPARRTQSAKPIPRGEEPLAPAPMLPGGPGVVPRQPRTADASQTSASGENWPAPRGGDSRERATRNGWQPAFDDNRETASTAVARRSRSEIVPVEESPARRRFRDAKERQAAAIAALRAEPIPSEEQRGTSGQDSERPVSPFHQEN